MVDNPSISCQGINFRRCHDSWYFMFWTKYGMNFHGIPWQVLPTIVAKNCCLFGRFWLFEICFRNSFYTNSGLIHFGLLVVNVHVSVFFFRPENIEQIGCCKEKIIIVFEIKIANLVHCSRALKLLFIGFMRVLSVLEHCVLV